MPTKGLRRSAYPHQNQVESAFASHGQATRYRKPQIEVLESRSLLSATPLGVEALINTTVTNDQKQVAIGSNPNSTQLVMAWASTSEDGSSDGVYAQRYDLYGAKVGTPFR